MVPSRKWKEGLLQAVGLWADLSEKATVLDIVVPLRRAEKYHAPDAARIVADARRTLEEKMALEFLLPDVGEDLAEAQILRWLVPVGGGVDVGQSMVELETDELVLEMPAPGAGVVLHHGAAEGEVIAVGSLLVVIGAAGEEWAPPEGDSAPESRGDEAASVSDDQVERVPLSATRRAIARNLTRSWQEIPHVTTFSEADATPLLRARADLAADTRDAAPLESLLITAVIPVLEEFPRFNASLQGDDLLLHKRYDIGFAVDTREGLMVAVLRQADRYGPPELARKIVTPIIPYGTTAILSVGRADLQPVVERDRVAIARRFPLSLSYDQRVIDGAMGRRFLGAVAAAIEGYGEDA